MVLKKSNYVNINTIGQVFTPKFIAKFMVNNCLKSIKSSYIFRDIQNLTKKITVLEPSTGEGVFLKYLLQNNIKKITAYEIDDNLKDILVNSYPEVEFRFENVFGSDLNDKYDLIIGNPPYLGQNYNAVLFQDYIKKYPICAKYFIGNMDLFYFFIHLSIEKLKPGGILSFITTNYWITKSEKTGVKYLKPHILKECYLLQYIDLSKLKLFKDAMGQHNCIFILQKKTEEEKREKIDKKIEIIQINKKLNSDISDDAFNKETFAFLTKNQFPIYINKYFSALSNNTLKWNGSWNLLYPEEVKKIIDKIERLCSKNDKIYYLKDFFLIRNGLILIKDNIFILKEDVSLKIENKNYFIKIDDNFHKLSDREKNRLKKIYKSKSIQPYGYNKKSTIGHVIYFNKKKFNSEKGVKRNLLFESYYPNLTLYLKQYEKELREILRNANENLNNIYFPRRGAFIRKYNKNQREELFDLEPLYDKGKKIFFKFISKNNTFGYTEDRYLATSDTYFLWPKESEEEIDYKFILAYLNSKLVSFIFKAKNISIKRSKTKLENEIPIPNLDKFKSNEKTSILSLIRILSSYLIKNMNSYESIELDELRSDLKSYSSLFDKVEILDKLIPALENRNVTFIQKVIDLLLFQLFDLKENTIDYLIKKYY
ncbi:MAG: Eco57I restriction-modification methylase domain-containing protein [Candidatus Hermodarchaeota archaeon]